MSTTSPPLTVPARPRARRAFTLPNWAYGTLVTLLVLVFIGGMTLLFGRVSGEEFSPHDFKRRTFHFYEIPVLGLQVWPVKRFDATGDLETQLVSLKAITPTTPAEPRWDLVVGYRGSTQVAEGDANILCRYLDQSDGKGGRTWLTWTTDHPKLSAVLWPLIAKLAREELYLFMPDMFELAKRATDAKELQSALEKLLASKYHDFGLVQQELGHHQAAAELLTEALKLSPDQPQWRQQLETSRAALPAEEKKSS